jgi:hypothetical protein
LKKTIEKSPRPAIIVISFCAKPFHVYQGELMDKWSFGISMTIVGMGGTLLTLWLLSLFTVILKRAFPPVPESRSTEKSEGGVAK